MVVVVTGIDIVVNLLLMILAVLVLLLVLSLFSGDFPCDQKDPIHAGLGIELIVWVKSFCCCCCCCGCDCCCC